MDIFKQISMPLCQCLLILTMLHRPTRGGFLFFASPGYDGIKKAGLWGGFINHTQHGQGQDLFMHGYQELELPSFYEYEGMRIKTLSYDPKSISAMVEVEEVHRKLTVVGKGAICPQYGPFIVEEPDPNVQLMSTILPDVVLVDGNDDHPYFMTCGWKCGWSGFALYDGKVYFLLSAVFGYRTDSLKRKIQIRVMNTQCQDLIQKAIKYEHIDTEFPVLQCSDHVVDVYEHAYDQNEPADTWVASPLKVVYDGHYNTMYFLLQLIQKSECDVTMSLVQTSNISHTTVWVHNQSLPSVYGGNAKIRGFGAIDYRDGMLCWTAAEVLLCGPIFGDKVSLVSMLLPPGAAHSEGICTGELPFAKVLTGVAVASSAPLRVYFGCYSELPGHGGAGLVEVNLSSAMEVVKTVYPVTSGGKKIYASSLFHVDNLCGPCTRSCEQKYPEHTTGIFRSTTSGVTTPRNWLEDRPHDGALTGAARTLVMTFSLIIHAVFIPSLVI